MVERYSAIAKYSFHYGFSFKFQHTFDIFMNCVYCKHFNWKLNLYFVYFMRQSIKSFIFVCYQTHKNNGYLISRYGYQDTDEDKKTFRPPPPKQVL